MCKEAKILLAVSTLFTFAMGLSGIFINVFFWKQTNNFIVIVLYNLMHYVFTPIAFIPAGALAKKKNGIWALRIGLLVYALFFALILFWGNKGIFYIYLLGMIYGTAIGFYWLAFNTLSFDFTHVNNRDTFNGFNGSCSAIAAAAAPMASAYIISTFSGMKGYYVVFAATLLLFVILLLVSAFLRCKNYGSKLNLKTAFSGNSKEWCAVWKSTGLWAIRDVTIVFVINILIIETTKSELSLGKLTFIASLISSASYVLVQKIIKPPRRRLSVGIGAIGSFLAVLGLALKVDYWTLFAYVVLDAFFLPFFLIQLNSATFNVINRAHEEDMRIEYMINKDFALNAGRIVSAGVLIALLSAFKELSILRAYLVFIGLAPVLSGYFLQKLKNILEG